MLPIIFDIGGGSGVWPVEMDCCGRIAPGEARGRGGGPMSCEARRDDEVEVGREDDAMLTGAAGTEFRSGAMLFVLRLVSRSAELSWTLVVLIVCSITPVFAKIKAYYCPCYDSPR